MSRESTEDRPAIRAHATRSRSASLAAPSPPAGRSVRPVTDVFAAPARETMFSLARTLPASESESDEEDTRSGTTSDEGEPLLTAHLAAPVRDSLLAHARQQEARAQDEPQEQAEQQQQREEEEEQQAEAPQQQQEAPQQQQEEEPAASAQAQQELEVQAPPAASQTAVATVASKARENVLRAKLGASARDTGSVTVEAGPLGPGEEAFAWGRYGGWEWERLEREWSLHWTAWGDVPGPRPDELETRSAMARWPRNGIKRARVEEEKGQGTAKASTAPSETKAESAAKAESEKAEKDNPDEPERPELNLEADIDYETLPVLPLLPSEAPSLQQTKLYKNYMKLRYETQRRNPEMELPKVVSGWYRDGKPASLDPEVQRNSQDASSKLQAAQAQLMAAKEGRLPVVKVTHRMSMNVSEAGSAPASPSMGGGSRRGSTSLSRRSETDGEEPKARKRFGTVKGGKRGSKSFGKKKDADRSSETLPDEMML